MGCAVSKAAEEKADEARASQEKRIAEEKAAEARASEEKLIAEKKASDARASEEKRIAEEKAAEARASEEKRIAEEKAAEARASEEKRVAEEKACTDTTVTAVTKSTNSEFVKQSLVTSVPDSSQKVQFLSFVDGYLNVLPMLRAS